MGDKSVIEWTDSTWNPVSGCTKVSAGCKFCYAERVSKRMGKEFTKVTLHPERLDQPLRWRKPRRIFVNSMSDLFHEDIPNDFIDRAFRVMQRSRRHTFQILTKRPERMRDFLSHCVSVPWGGYSYPDPWGKHIWLGVSCENQEQADKRIPLLLQTPAEVRFVSLEPLLGPISFRTGPLNPETSTMGEWSVLDEGIHWVIVGGESGGPSERALVYSQGLQRVQGGWVCSASTCPQFGHMIPEQNREAHRWHPKSQALAWVRSIRDQCVAAGVPFFFKQWGGPRPTSGGRMLDGKTWDEYPA